MNSLWLQTVSQGEVPTGAPLSPLNHCLRADGQGLGPTAGGNLQDLEKTYVVFGAARVYTVAVPGPKWKSW